MPAQDGELNACAKSVTATAIRHDGLPYARISTCDCLGFVAGDELRLSRICQRCGHFRVNHYRRDSDKAAARAGHARVRIDGGK